MTQRLFSGGQTARSRASQKLETLVYRSRACDSSWIPDRTASADLGVKMHLREPQQREYETTDAKPQHNDNQLAKMIVPASLGKIGGNRCHQVNVPNNR